MTDAFESLLNSENSTLAAFLATYQGEDLTDILVSGLKDALRILQAEQAAETRH